MPDSILELMNAERYLNSLWNAVDQAKRQIDLINLNGLSWVSITM